MTLIHKEGIIAYPTGFLSLDIKNGVATITDAQSAVPIKTPILFGDMNSRSGFEATVISDLLDGEKPSFSLRALGAIKHTGDRKIIGRPIITYDHNMSIFDIVDNPLKGNLDMDKLMKATRVAKYKRRTKTRKW